MANLQHDNGSGNAGPWFRGVPLTTKYAGTCHVCHEQIKAGALVIFNRDQRKISHVGCGTIERRRGR